MDELLTGIDNPDIGWKADLPPVNGAGVPVSKLCQSPGRPKGARNLHAKHPSSLARRLKAHGVDWVEHFAAAVKRAGSLDRKERAYGRDMIGVWLKLLPYLVTTTNKIKIKRFKGKASRAAIAALDALEGKE